MKTRLAFATLAIAASLAASVPAYAQTVTASSGSSVAFSCPAISVDIFRGSTDVSSNGAVTRLQTFLASLGYFDSANIGTGYFGPLTYGAVVRFQKAEGVRATGYFGPLSRAAMLNRNCGIVPPKSNVSLYSENPTSGTIGTTVSLTGFGFTSSNTVLMDGLLAARTVPITSSIAVACTTDPSCKGGIRQTIEFTIPSTLSPNCPIGSYCALFLRQVTPGTYTVTVVNDNGTSNQLSFTVTSGTGGNGTLSISGLDAPSTLSLGSTGTWTVHATSANGGQLHYSVVWGDEATYASGIMQPVPQSVSTSASFTHAYSRTGTYTPVFTVSDDSGHSATVSATVTVTPLY